MPSPILKPHLIHLGKWAMACLFMLAVMMSANAYEIKSEIPVIQWSQLPPLPDREGFAGMFAGVVSGRLVVAGGANFPEAYPWEGGRKYWYDHIYVLESKTAPAWKKLPLKLPRPLAYGVSWSAQNRLICAGGETGPLQGDQSASQPACVADVFAIEFTNGEFQIKSLPPLPEPAKDACGATMGEHLVHFGGVKSNQAVDASKSCHMLNLNQTDPHWTKLTNFPGCSRIQAVATESHGRFLVFSGIEIKADDRGKAYRKIPYLFDAWEYEPNADFSAGRWNQLKDLPVESAAAPGPAWPLVPNLIAIAGGADSARHKLPQKNHQGWSHNLLIYNTALDTWTTIPNAIPDKAAVVTAPAVRWGDEYVIISGEIAPGRRSPAVWKLSVSNKSELK